MAATSLHGFADVKRAAIASAIGSLRAGAVHSPLTAQLGHENNAASESTSYVNLGTCERLVRLYQFLILLTAWPRMIGSSKRPSRTCTWLRSLRCSHGQVRMWRVRLERPGSARGLPADPPYDALRLEELPLSFLTCDCSAEGNSFCILFRESLKCEAAEVARSTSHQDL